MHRYLRSTIVFLIISFIPLAAALAADEEKAAEEDTPKVEAAAAGQMTCETEIYYSWKRTPPPQNEKERANSAPTPAEPSEVFFRRIAEDGTNEQLIRTLLGSRLSEEQGAALTLCKREHENSAGCVSNKLKMMSTEYRTLGFAARKAVLESISADCKHSQGTCLTTRASEVRCYKLTVDDAPKAETTAEEAEAEPAEDEKDAKKKKKKK